MVGVRVTQQLSQAHPLRKLALLGEAADPAQDARRIVHGVETEYPHFCPLRTPKSEKVFDE
jgi:hypothetical protein